MNGEQFELWIRYLEEVRRRPANYMGTTSPEITQAFLHGYFLAVLSAND